jgi:predicted nucleotidyltransferase
VKPRDPNLPLLESVARAFGPLRERFVFIGGCVSGLLVTDAAAPPARTTRDVDVIVEVLTLAEYHHLEKDLLAAGFRHDRSPDAPMCRWTIGAAIVDIMPSEEGVLGFGNRWYPEAIRTAGLFSLPSGGKIRLITAPLFLATKLEAFGGRGRGDYQASHDLEDIVAIIDGRPEIVSEVEASTGALRDYLTKQIAALLNEGAFMQALPGHLPGDEPGQGRLPVIVGRMRQIASL